MLVGSVASHQAIAADTSLRPVPSGVRQYYRFPGYVGAIVDKQRRKPIMPKIAGRIIDKHTGETVAARVHVLSVEGRFVHPQDALLKVGPGIPFFYSDGQFVLDAP